MTLTQNIQNVKFLTYRLNLMIFFNLKHVSRCLEKSRMAKMAREWLDGTDPVISPQRACAKTVVKYK